MGRHGLLELGDPLGAGADEVVVPPAGADELCPGFGAGAELLELPEPVEAEPDEAVGEPDAGGFTGEEDAPFAAEGVGLFVAFFAALPSVTPMGRPGFAGSGVPDVGTPPSAPVVLPTGRPLIGTPRR